MKRETIKIDGKLVKLLRERKKKTGQNILWQVEQAIESYLKGK